MPSPQLHWDLELSFPGHYHSQLDAATRFGGHLSPAIHHLGNISYYLGASNRGSIDHAEQILADVKSLDNNRPTLYRTARYLTDNGVE